MKMPGLGSRRPGSRPASLVVLRLAVAGSIAAAGCGQGVDGEAELESPTSARLTLPTCDQSFTTWPDPNSTTSTCAGPFEYYPACYKASPRATAPNGGDSACGIDAYVQTTCF